MPPLGLWFPFTDLDHFLSFLLGGEFTSSSRPAPLVISCLDYFWCLLHSRDYVPTLFGSFLMSSTQQKLSCLDYFWWLLHSRNYVPILFGWFLMTSTQQRLCPTFWGTAFPDINEQAKRDGHVSQSCLYIFCLKNFLTKLFVCFLNPENLMLNACGKTSCLYACKNSLCKRTECIHISQQDCTKGSGYVSIICPHLCVEYAHIYTITGYLFVLQAKPAEEYVNNSSSWIFLSKKQQQHFISVQTQDLSVSVFM